MRPLRLPLGTLLVALAAVLAALPACDSGGEIGPDLDYRLLFGEPTPEEVQAVLDAWDGRANPVRDAQVVDSAVVDDATLYIVSHTQTDADGGAFTHYGLVRIPARDSVAAIPVLVYHHEGDGGFSISDFLQTFVYFPVLADETVQVVPVYRAEAITADTLLSGTYTAGGTPSPWDRDVDDAIGLLNVVLELFPDVTDESRVSALGIGRGGNTALLHAVRDDRVAVVTDYFGPADFFNETAQLVLSQALEGNPDARAVPGMAYLADTVLEPLSAGTLTYDEARLELAYRSPGLFGTRLPDTQLHHHRQDPVVPAGFSEAFAARIVINPVDGEFDVNVYTNPLPGGVASFHSITALPPSLGTVNLGSTQRFQLEHLDDGGKTP
jgi:hypothetical protein